MALLGGWWVRSKINVYSMKKSIYVGNLPFGATEDEISDLFSPFGEILSVKIVRDRETGRSRGFAFVDIETDSVDAAIEATNDQPFGGRPLKVNEAREREERPQRSERTFRSGDRDRGGRSGGGRSFRGGDRGDRGDRRERSHRSY